MEPVIRKILLTGYEQCKQRQLFNSLKLQTGNKKKKAAKLLKAFTGQSSESSQEHIIGKTFISKR